MERLLKVLKILDLLKQLGFNEKQIMRINKLILDYEIDNESEEE